MLLVLPNHELQCRFYYILISSLVDKCHQQEFLCHILFVVSLSLPSLSYQELLLYSYSLLIRVLCVATHTKFQAIRAIIYRISFTTYYIVHKEPINRGFIMGVANFFIRINNALGCN